MTTAEARHRRRLARVSPRMTDAQAEQIATLAALDRLAALGNSPDLLDPREVQHMIAALAHIVRALVQTRGPTVHVR